MTMWSEAELKVSFGIRFGAASDTKAAAPDSDLSGQQKISAGPGSSSDWESAGIV